MTVLLQDLVTDQASRRPDALALAFDNERLSYAGLEEFSDRLAAVLRDVGCMPGDRVCLLMPKSPRTVGAMLATLKAGAMYVPLDMASPPARLARIVASCENAVMLACAPSATILAELRRLVPAGTAVIGWLDEASPRDSSVPAFTLKDVALAPPGRPTERVTSDAGAHILFTSGSTGEPKGVVVRHSSVVHFVEWATHYFGTVPGDRISGHPPFHFDLSTFDIFGTLSAGASLHLVPPELNVFPNKLADFVRSTSLTQWFSVPSVLNLLLRGGGMREGVFPDLRRVIWCGDVIPTPTLQEWMRLVPHATYTNLYGPTETTIASAFHRVPSGLVPDGPIPIGRACPGESVQVLGENLVELAPRETGEIYIGGVGLSPGYWRDVGKTAHAFVPNPFSCVPGDRLYRTGDLGRRDEDGLVYFLGRADSQVKTRGYRVELGEIEAALHGLGCLRECAVVAVGSGDFDGVSICCAFVPDGPKVTPLVLRGRLAELLPAYMLPTRWLESKALPRNANEKIDRPSLKLAFQRGDDRVSPASALAGSEVSGGA